MRLIVLVIIYINSCFSNPLEVDIKDSNGVFPFNSMTKVISNDRICLNFGKKKSDILILTDRHVSELFKMKRKYKTVIAWLVEPKVIVEEHLKCYSFVEQNINRFDYVFTFDKNLIKKFPNKAVFLHALGGAFLKEKGICSKKKLCSFITSNKSWATGHKFRHICLSTFKKYFSDYKDGSLSIPYKDPFLNEFCFSVVIENNQNQDYYFSEKIMDCFEKGVIPIYWGPYGVENFFCREGIIRFHSLDDLEIILSNLTFEMYQQKFHYVKQNYETSKRFCNDNFLNVLYETLFNIIPLN